MSNEDKNSDGYFFKKLNYQILLAGLGLSILGFILMIGGGSEDPTKFDGDALFSFQRITLAPILVILGYAIVIYAIMKKPKSED